MLIVTFRPSPAQRRLLDAIRRRPDWSSITALCENAGVDRSSYYVWCKSPEFRQWLLNVWSSGLISQSWPLIQGARQSMAHSARDFKALFDLTFDPRGFAAHTGTQPEFVSEFPQSHQSLTSTDSTNFQHSPPLPPPFPGRAACYLVRTLRRLQPPSRRRGRPRTSPLH